MSTDSTDRVINNETKFRMSETYLLSVCVLTEGETAEHREDLQPAEEGKQSGTNGMFFGVDQVLNMIGNCLVIIDDGQYGLMRKYIK